MGYTSGEEEVVKFGNNISGSKYALMRRALEEKSLDQIDEIK